MSLSFNLLDTKRDEIDQEKANSAKELEELSQNTTLQKIERIEKAILKFTENSFFDQVAQESTEKASLFRSLIEQKNNIEGRTKTNFDRVLQVLKEQNQKIEEQKNTDVFDQAVELKTAKIREEMEDLKEKLYRSKEKRILLERKNRLVKNLESKLYLKLNQQNADIIVLKDLMRKATQALVD